MGLLDDIDEVVVTAKPQVLDQKLIEQRERERQAIRDRFNNVLGEPLKEVTTRDGDTYQTRLAFGQGTPTLRDLEWIAHGLTPQGYSHYVEPLPFMTALHYNAPEIANDRPGINSKIQVFDGWRDARIVAHELAHQINFLEGKDTTLEELTLDLEDPRSPIAAQVAAERYKFRQQLGKEVFEPGMPIPYDRTKKRRRPRPDPKEVFADLFAIYVMDPDGFNKRAPDAAKMMRRLINENPVFNETYILSQNEVPAGLLDQRMVG